MRPSLAAALLISSLAAQEVPPGQPARLPGSPSPSTPAPAAKVVPGDPAPFAAAAAAWFPVMDQSLEAGAGVKEVKAVYAFKNPRDRDIEWRNLTGSCTCSHAAIAVGDRRYELRSKQKQLVQIVGAPGAESAAVVESIAVHAGEAGRVEVYVETQGAKGPKVVSLDIHTTDAEVAMVRLHARVTVPQLVVLEPAAVILGVAGVGEVRDFVVQVTPLAKDFEITGAAPFPTGVTATYERVPGSGSNWRIKGSFRQDTPGDVNPTLVFRTNQPDVPTVLLAVHASVRALVEMKPAFFAVGRVQKGRTGSARVTFVSAGAHDLNVVAMRLENLNVDAKHFTLRASKEGKDVVVELEVAADAPAGLIRGEVVVDLDHKVVQQRRVLFNGFVR